MRILLLMTFMIVAVSGYGQVPALGHAFNYGVDSTGKLNYQKQTYITAKSYEAARKIRNIDTFDIVTITADRIYGDFKVDPSDVSSPDDTAMILVTTSGQRLKRVVSDRLDCKWFGCLGDGVTDDWYNMQRGINWSIAHPDYPRWFFVSKGFYIMSKGIEVELISGGTTYQFYSIKISGEKGVTYFGKENYLTQIGFLNVNEFAFNFQNCRASEISGLIISGQYHCPVNFTPDGKMFYRTKFTDFYDGVCRTDRYSPHVGICTDALRGNGSAPPGGGYSRFASQYTTVTGSGCSGLTVTDVSIRNFVVAFAASVGGGSPNSENIQLETVEFRENIVGYSSGQSQEKENSVKHLTSWWPQHTVFDNLNFGAGSGVCPNIDGVNIAGYCIRAFNINNSGYYLTSINNVFAESILQVGNLWGQMNIWMGNSTFDLLSNIDWPKPEWVINCNSTTIENCTIRYYSGAHERWPMAAFNTEFIGCTFGGVPILLDNDFRTGQSSNVNFINCSVNTTTGVVMSSGGMYGVPGGSSSVTQYLPNGKATIRYSESIQLRYDDAKFFRFQSSVETVTLIVDTLNNRAKFYSPNTNRYQVGDAILNDNNSVVYYDDASGDNVGGGPQWFGIVDSVLADTIKLNHINRELANGSSSKTLAFDRLVYTGKLFIGDVTSGSNVISNVKVYDVNNWPTVGYTMDWPTGFFNNTVYVTAVDTAAKTITVNWNSGQTQKGVRFFNNNPKIIRNYQSSFFNSNTIFDGIMFTDDEISADVVPAANADLSIKPTFKILTSGYKDSSGVKKAIIKNVYGKSVIDTAGNYAALGVEDVVNVNASSGNATVTLFSATDTKYWGKNILIKKIDSSANTVTVTRSGTDSIDGGLTVVLNSVYNWVEVVSNGRGKFRIINQTGSGGGGAVSSVSNSDGSLTVSPTTGGVVTSLNLAHSNTFTVPQSISPSGQVGLNINMSNTADGTFAVNFNRASTSVENIFNWATNGTANWALGQDNDGTSDMIMYSWVANKYLFKAYSSSGDMALGNGLSALYLRQGDQSVGFNSTSPSFGHYINRKVGINKDSVTTINSISTGMLLVIDTGANGIYKMLPSNLAINTLYTADGSLPGDRAVAGASHGLSLGTGGSPLAALSITSSGRVSLFSGITYDVDANNTDADYTVAGNTIIVEVSDVLTTNRTLTMPSATQNGQSLTLLMRYSTGVNKYSLSAAVTDNATGSTFTTLDWGKTYDFMVDQSLSWRLIRKY